MKPLEARFPTLYYEIVHEREAGKDEVKERRTPKETDPTLFDVVAAVCSVHRVTDTVLMKDLTASVTEFLFPDSPKAKKGKKAEAGKVQVMEEED